MTYQAQYYQTNKVKLRINQEIYRSQLKLFVKQLKESTPCFDCHIQYMACVMQFDHLPQYKKSFNISQEFKSVGMKGLQKEISKCSIVCANCHAIRTQKRREIHPM